MSAAERAFAEAREQGLPERVADPSVLAQVAELIASAPPLTSEQADRIRHLLPPT